jgi:MoxR-like ATPase
VRRGLTIDDSILDYAVRMVRATREWQGIDSGAGPRASIALVRAARAHALLAATTSSPRTTSRPSAMAVLRHRIKLGAELEIEGYRADDVLAELLAGVDAPRA